MSQLVQPSQASPNTDHTSSPSPSPSPNTHQLINPQSSSSTQTALQTSQVNQLPLNQLIGGSDEQQQQPEIWQPNNEPKKLPRATIEQRIRVLDWYHLNSSKSQRAVVKYFQSLNEFCIAKSSFNRWVQDEKEIRSDFAKYRSFEKGNVRTRASIKFPLVEYAVSRYYEQGLYEFGDNFEKAGITGNQLISKWFYFAKMVHPEMDFSNVKKGHGWLQHFRFKHRERADLILNYKKKIEPIITLTNSIEDEKRRIQLKLSNFKPSDVFHFDEFSVTSRILPTDYIQLKFLVAIGVNSNNTEWLPLLKVSNSTDEVLRLDPNHHQSNTGLLTDEILDKYFQQIDRTIENSFSPNRKILILLDTLHEHIVKKYSHIEFCYFNPKFQAFFSNLDQKNYSNSNNFIRQRVNCEIQPLNLGIVKNFKLEFKLNLLKHHLSYIETKKIKSLKPLTIELISELVDETFNSIKSNDLNKQILKCWQTSELLPESEIRKSSAEQYNYVFRPESELNFWKILGILQGKGVLNYSDANIGIGSFNLDQILFPLDEYVMNKKYTDSEIIALVNLQVEEKNFQINKNKNVPIDDGTIDKDTLIQINKLLNVDLLNFFRSNISKFPESNRTFQKFMNSFIKESMGLYLNDKNGERPPPFETSVGYGEEDDDEDEELDDLDDGQELMDERE